jgi:hypothetical protein
MGQTGCPTAAGQGARRGSDGARRGQTGCPTGPDGVVDGRIIYFEKKKRHVLYTCHVNHRQHPTCLTSGGCKNFLR